MYRNFHLKLVESRDVKSMDMESRSSADFVYVRGPGTDTPRIPRDDYAAAAAKSLQSCLTLCDPIEGAHQASPSLGFSRQEHWSGLPFPSLMHESEK